MSRIHLMTGLWLLGLIAAYQLGKLTRTEVVSVGGSVVPESQPGPEFQRKFQRLFPAMDEGKTHDELFLLADSWALKDPERATEWLAKLELDDGRNPYLFSAFSQWASQDPEAAKVWLDGFPQKSDYLLAGLIRGMSVSNPGGALAILLAAPNSPERTGAIDFLIHSWKGVSLAHAFEKVSALDGDLKEAAIRKLTGSLTGAQLEEAREWAGAAAQVGIAARWSQSDPAAAAEWASNLTEPDTRRNALGEVGARWGRIDPLAASAWLAERAGQAEADLAARGIASSTVGIDPDKAFAQVAGITQEGLRDETFEQIGRFWLSREPQDAKRFLERESALPAGIREKLLEVFE